MVDTIKITKLSGSLFLFRVIIYKTNFEPHDRIEESVKTFSSRKSETITCFFQFSDQNKRKALCLLARLIHITTKNEGRFGMRAPRCPL